MSNSNHADKRSVSTDALETLGTIIGPDEKRDAIHIAVEPVIAGEDLQAGDHVGFRMGGPKTIVYRMRNRDKQAVGIVDPFLPTHTVRQGERFWLLIYPRRIKSLRHVWSHPDFEDSEIDEGENIPINYIKEESEVILKAFADRIGVSYKQLLAGAERYLRTGSTMHDGGKFESVHVGAGFWDHYEAVTGEKVDPDKKDNFFSCSC